MLYGSQTAVEGTLYYGLCLLEKLKTPLCSFLPLTEGRESVGYISEPLNPLKRDENHVAVEVIVPNPVKIGLLDWPLVQAPRFCQIWAWKSRRGGQDLISPLLQEH